MEMNIRIDGRQDRITLFFLRLKYITLVTNSVRHDATNNFKIKHLSSVSPFDTKKNLKQKFGKFQTPNIPRNPSRSSFGFPLLLFLIH